VRSIARSPNLRLWCEFNNQQINRVSFDGLIDDIEVFPLDDQNGRDDSVADADWGASLDRRLGGLSRVDCGARTRQSSIVPDLAHPSAPPPLKSF